MAEGKQDFVKIITDVFGAADVLDVEVLFVDALWVVGGNAGAGGAGAGGKGAEVQRGLDETFAVGTGVNDHVEWE